MKYLALLKDSLVETLDRKSLLVVLIISVLLILVCASIGFNELDASGRVARHDIEAQCRAVFENVRVVLEDAGSSWDRLVDVTVFLTAPERAWATYNRVYEEYFGAVKPCRTTVGVARLPGPIAIELKCIATLPDGPR